MKKKQDMAVSNTHFKRIFISYDVQQKMFMQEYRRFIGVDGCHLRANLVECYYLQLLWTQIMKSFY